MSVSYSHLRPCYSRLWPCCSLDLSLFLICLFLCPYVCKLFPFETLLQSALALLLLGSVSFYVCLIVTFIGTFSVPFLSLFMSLSVSYSHLGPRNSRLWPFCSLGLSKFHIRIFSCLLFLMLPIFDPYDTHNFVSVPYLSLFISLSL